MNGAHDLGGIQAFGAVPREDNEPVFHRPWEGHVVAMTMLLLGSGVFNGGQLRYAMESLSPARYLTDSYHERWLDRLESVLITRGILSRGELAERRQQLASSASPDVTPADPALPRKLLAGSQIQAHRDITRPPAFAVGDQVIARNLNPRGHTRLPRYVRGRRGTIERVCPPSVFPDTQALGQGENLQHSYEVRFEARELWGADAAEPAQSVLVGLWERYLEAAYVQ